MLKKTNNTQPFVFLRGLKSLDLEAILEFIYSGECRIDHVKLNDFLILAEELQIKGVSGTSPEGFNISDTNKKLDNINDVTVLNGETFQKGLTNNETLRDTKDIIPKEISSPEIKEQ